MTLAIIAAAVFWLTLIYASVEQYRIRLRDFDQDGSEYPPNGDCLSFIPNSTGTHHG